MSDSNIFEDFAAMKVVGKVIGNTPYVEIPESTYQSIVLQINSNRETASSTLQVMDHHGISNQEYMSNQYMVLMVIIFICIMGCFMSCIIGRKESKIANVSFWILLSIGSFVGLCTLTKLLIYALF